MSTCWIKNIKHINYNFTLKLVFWYVYLEVILRVWLDTVYLIENWKHGSKIIFKYMNSVMRSICNKSFVEKKSLYIRSIESALALLKRALKNAEARKYFSALSKCTIIHVSTLSLVGNVGSLTCERVVLCIIGLRGKQIDVQMYFSWTKLRCVHRLTWPAKAWSFA